MRIFIIFCLAFPLLAGHQMLSLDAALELVKRNNLEIKVSKEQERIRQFEAGVVEGKNYGQLDLVVQALRSNDAGNVFGFKLQSREATFGDFGFDQFLAPMGEALMVANGGGLTPEYLQGMQSILTVQPDNLNYPGSRNHFQEKIQYSLPLYTGGQLHEYGKITRSMVRMARMDTRKVMQAKIFEIKKAFYDISLVEAFIKDLNAIYHNVEKLEEIVNSMKDEGYAIDIDLLQVKSKKADVLRMFNQAKLNRDLAYQFLSFLVDEPVDSIQLYSGLVPVPQGEPEALAQGNIDVHKARLGLEISQMAIRAEQSSYLPMVGAFAEYGSADNTFMNEFFDKDAYTVGVQMKWNLFNGFSDYRKVEKAKVENLKVRTQVEFAQKGIALQIKKLQTQIQSEEYDITSLEEKLKFAERVYANFSERYRLGLVSINDVLIKQSEQIEALLQLTKEKVERNKKVFELEKLIAKDDV